MFYSLKYSIHFKAYTQLICVITHSSQDKHRFNCHELFRYFNDQIIIQHILISYYKHVHSEYNRFYLLLRNYF